ncbi:MAG: ATP-binding protein [Candidatus Korobacteraceae bacterium]
MPEATQSVEHETLAKELVFTGDPAAMVAARDGIMDFLHQHCAGEQEEIDIMIALQEGLANAVLHGCQNDPSKIIRCSVDVTPQAITIVIKDPGQGFDTSAATDSADDGTNLTQHGRGICLMRSLMDEVSYRHGGSELQLKKLRTRQL